MLAYTEHYTVDDYRQWPGDWELIKGAPLAMTPSPSVTHQMIAVHLVTQLTTELRDCKECHALMETDWEIASDTVVRPDVFVICYEPEEKIIQAPKLIFEVISASSTRRDEQLKFELYQNEGVSYYGIVYPENKTVKLYQLVNPIYKKLGDYSEEKLNLKINNCKIQLDFALSWRT